MNKFSIYRNSTFTHQKCILTFIDKLPFSIRVLLESTVRNCDNFQITENDVNTILGWEKNQRVKGGMELNFKPARVILQVY